MWDVTQIRNATHTTFGFSLACWKVCAEHEAWNRWAWRRQSTTASHAYWCPHYSSRIGQRREEILSEGEGLWGSRWERDWGQHGRHKLTRLSMRGSPSVSRKENFPWLFKEMALVTKTDDLIGAAEVHMLQLAIYKKWSLFIFIFNDDVV